MDGYNTNYNQYSFGNYGNNNVSYTESTNNGETNNSVAAYPSDHVSEAAAAYYQSVRQPDMYSNSYFPSSFTNPHSNSYVHQQMNSGNLYQHPTYNYHTNAAQAPGYNLLTPSSHNNTTYSTGQNIYPITNNGLQQYQTNTHHASPSNNDHNYTNQNILEARQTLCDSPTLHALEIFELLDSDTSNEGCMERSKAASWNNTATQGIELEDPIKEYYNRTKTPPVNTNAVSNMNQQHHLPTNESSHPQSSKHHQVASTNKYESDNELANFKIPIPDISVEPLSALSVLKRVEDKCQDVLNCYLPCVQFLVQCQQELRVALEAILPSKYRKERSKISVTHHQFYNTCFLPLPSRFHRTNQSVMDKKNLDTSVTGINNLLLDVKRVLDGKVEKSDTKKVEKKFEDMKNTFLGGMRDNESWGLRKWLSKHGNALYICNDLESILNVLRKLSRDSVVVQKMAKEIRGFTRPILTKLQKDIPAPYQLMSTAHPYLPYFHRLESVLKSMAEFDPEDDDVICLDDEPEDIGNANVKNTSADSHKHSIHQPKASSTEEKFVSQKQITHNIDEEFSTPTESPAITQRTHVKFSQSLAENIENLLNNIEKGVDPRPLDDLNPTDFWTFPKENYIFILRSFRSTILNSTSLRLLMPVSYSISHESLQKYKMLIKNPLSFTQIVLALATNDRTVSNTTTGKLDCPNLERWNMFGGTCLIQAIDLVFLNELAYLGSSSKDARQSSIITILRHQFWTSIKDYASRNNISIPEKRKPNSSFVIKNLKSG